ncbi:MAG: GTP cyclohydrolase II [Immundisolibacterales bacterium]|nr:GTP cyclohydrolase II [Immundisolibacterales bacterium]
MSASEHGGIAKRGDPAAASAGGSPPALARRHIRLSSHPGGTTKPVAIEWGAPDPKARGPVLGSVRDGSRRNVIGAHSGSYSLYRALAVAAGQLDPVHVPDLTDTAPAEPIGPYPQWAGSERIVSLDPFGHMVSEAFADEIAGGLDIRPTIAVTKAHLTVPEIKGAIEAGRLSPDGEVLTSNGDARVTKMAIEPVWYLPGIAARFGIGEAELRRALFEESGGMYTELVTRPDVKVFLPPVGGITVYGFGDVGAPAHAGGAVTCRVHDECNGSDVFGSDICTCRPYLTHGIEECIAAAQGGGTGFVVYNRKEGRALGEVTKFLVYNARKRQPGGDRAETYFERTECVAGVQDMRFQELMPDVLHWLGIRRIDRFVSMSDMKRDAIEAQGIAIGRQVPIPPDLVPDDAQVEITAKRAAGYYSDVGSPSSGELQETAGRSLTD